MTDSAPWRRPMRLSTLSSAHPYPGRAKARPLMVNEDAPLDVEKPFEANYLKQKADTGIPNWVALFAAIPLGALILLWVVAFKDKLDGGAK